jgi:hypothetical protein
VSGDGPSTLKAFSINMLAIKFTWFDTIQTIHIYCDDWRSIGHRTVGETLDTASGTKKMTYGFPVEQVLGQIALTGLQLKALTRGKSKNKSHPLAAGTVAGNGIIQIHFDCIADCTALAATFIM